MTLDHLYAKEKYIHVQEKIKELTLTSKELKTTLKTTKDSEIRGKLYQTQALIARQLTYCLSEYNLLKKKENHHKTISKIPFYEIPLKKYYPISNKILILFNKDMKRLEMYVLKELVENTGNITSKVINLFDDNCEIKEIKYSNYTPHFVIDFTTFLSCFFNENVYNKLHVENYFNTFKVEKRDFDKFCLKLETFKQLLLVEINYKKKREEIMVKI